MAYFVVFATAADQSAIGNGDEMSAPLITAKPYLLPSDSPWRGPNRTQAIRAILPELFAVTDTQHTAKERVIGDC